MQNLVQNRAGETIIYAPSDEYAFTYVNKWHVKNGAVTGIESEDLINPNMPMEDQYVSESAITNGLIEYRGISRDYGIQGFLTHPDRAMYPMKRVSADRGTLTGQFVRITWDEALNTVAQNMQAVQTRYGNYSIWNNPLGAWQGCNVTGWGDDSTEGGDFALRFTFNSMWAYNYPPGVYFAGMDGPTITTMFKSNLIVLLGHNAVLSLAGGTGGQTGFYYRLAHEKGIPIICIDPVYTMAAQVCADQWIPIRQGTDAAFLLAVANVLFKEDLYDTDFVSKYVEPTGFAKWEAYVLGQTAGPDGAIDRTPQWAAPICGIPADTITAFAELYAKSTPCFFTLGAHVNNKQPSAQHNVRISAYLQAMTGNTGVEGGTDGIGGSPAAPGSPMYGQPYWPTVGPSVDVGKTPGTFTLPISPMGSPALFIHYRLPDAILLRQQYDQGTITEAQYVNSIGPIPTILSRTSTWHLQWKPSLTKLLTQTANWRPCRHWISS